MMPARLAKVGMVASLALFTFVVTMDNIIDYDANFSFVRHVLSMDTTFLDDTLRWRAITEPTLWHVFYALIILGEGLTCSALALAALQMARALRSSPPIFKAAKRHVHTGALIGFAVWFTGFMVIGGEWFAMWQSQTWNGQQAAFRFYVTLLVVLIYVCQPESEIG
jgi:predicted small integral membrane protein